MSNKQQAPARTTHSSLKLQLQPDVSIDLRAEAKRRGVEYDDLAACILAAVAKDQLYCAILDI